MALVDTQSHPDDMAHPRSPTFLSILTIRRCKGLAACLFLPGLCGSRIISTSKFENIQIQKDNRKKTMFVIKFVSLLFSTVCFPNGESVFT